MNDNIYENVISDKKAKEYYGNVALTILSKLGIIKSKKDIDNLAIEFAYIFKKSENDYPTLFKVITSPRLLNKSKIYYFGTQNGKVLLLKGFNEEKFKKTQQEMFEIHKVNTTIINWNEYKMVFHSN